MRLLRFATVLFALTAPLSACSGGGGAAGGALVPAASVQSPTTIAPASTSSGTASEASPTTAVATLDYPAVSASAGQLAVTLPDDVDPSTVAGYIVGKQTDLQIKAVGDGRYYIDNIPPGTQDAIITAGSLAVQAALTASGPDRGVRLNGLAVEAGKRIDKAGLKLPKLGRLVGHVFLSNPGSEGHIGIQAFIPGTGYAALTDKDGNFAIEGVPVGTHNLYASKNQYYSGQIEAIAVAEDATTTVPDVTLALDKGVVDGFVEVEGGAARVGKRTVSVIVGSAKNALLMALSEDKSFTGAGYVPVVTTTTFTFQSDGPRKLYVRFSNAGGLENSFESSTFDIDTSAPTAVLAGKPAARSRLAALNVTVSGDDAGPRVGDLKTYRFKVGAQGGTDCGTPAGYSDPAPNTTPIAASLAGLGDGPARLCVVGADDLGNTQDFAAATQHDWIQDTTLPEIAASGRFPAAGSIDALVSTTVHALFSEPIDPDTLTGAFGLTYGGSPVSGAIAFDPETLVATFTPSTPLAGRGVYTATFADSITDAAGNALASPVTWSFTTGAGWSNRHTASSVANTEVRDVQSAADAAGNTYLVWTQRPKMASATADRAYVGRIAAGQDPSTIAIKQLATIQSVKPQVGFDATGNAIVTWVEPVEPAIKAARYASGAWAGGTAPTVWNGAGGNRINDYKLGVLANGNAIVVLIRDLSANGSTVWMETAAYDKNTDTWSETGRIDDDTDSRNIPEYAMLGFATNAQNKAIAVWTELDTSTLKSIVHASHYAAGSWDANHRTLSDTAIGASGARVAIDDAGHAFAVWYSTVSGVENIYALHFDGSAWENSASATKLDNHSASGGGSQQPAITMNASGSALAAWVQPKAGGYDLWARSFDGTTWAANPLHVETATASPSAHAIALSPSGLGQAVWLQGAHLTTAKFQAGTWSTAQTLDETESCAAAATPGVFAYGTDHFVSSWESCYSDISQASDFVSFADFR